MAQNQAMYDNFVGARVMLKLQNYGNATQVYDGDAYTISSTYYPGTSTLQIYITHPGPPASGGSESQYYLTQLDTYGMTGNINSFRSGAAAYRNARDWTTQQRDGFIAKANVKARRQSTKTRSFNTGANDSNFSSAAVEEPSSAETSADERVLDNDAIVKRQRRLTRD